jgi:cell division protein FtsI (penicillin-binding protein 3)
VSAPVFKRIAEATLQYLGVPPTINPPAPVLVARYDGSVNAAVSREAASQPVVSLVADEPAGTVPDLRGMSAREAVRKLVKLGITARASGDGFVVSQDPPAGTPIDAAAGVCRLVLQRWPLRSPTASQP